IEAPKPLSDDLFSRVLVNIPTNLFLLGERNAAFDIAEMLEEISADKPRQLLRLATFYIGIKYATGARRLSEKSILLDPEEALAHHTLGIAQRLGFDLLGAEASYARALELDPDSLVIRQSLGEIKRALGKPDEAEALFSEILARTPNDSPARTGLILSLYDQNKRKEAEALLVTELNDNPVNAFVMIGAANWYAANGEPQLAIDHTKVAVTIEESAVWGYVVMARGYMLQNKPQDAERSLLAASRFGASPAVSYELALARYQTGFYREAAEELRNHFKLEDGKVVTELDGRIGAEAESFADLVRLEQKSYLFSGASRFDAEGDRKLKELLEFEDRVSNAETADDILLESADSFAGSADPMKTFRQVYISKCLLDAGRLPAQAVRMAQDAAKGVESSVENTDSSAAVLADELYDRRKAAARSGRVVIVPEIEKPTLVRIMRGRIEELAARSLIAEEDYAGAEVRLRRAVSVLPKESAWWRSSMWHLGNVYEKLGDDRKALNSYASSYVAGEPLLDKRAKLESIYSKVNGSIDGFEDLVSGKKDTTTDDSASLFLKTTSGAKSSSESTPPKSDKESGEIGAIRTGDAAPPAAEATVRDKEPQEAVAAVVVTKKSLAEDLNLSLIAADKNDSVPQLSTGVPVAATGLQPDKPAVVPETDPENAPEIPETPKVDSEDANPVPPPVETPKDDAADASTVSPPAATVDSPVVETAKPETETDKGEVAVATPKNDAVNANTVP
ncbi:MAG: tetratricopeptide repeat protein, partial [Acidobacteriota bacterium]|nr:tetratricopeptide repeat protein [Acidobacteriota bacterium]